jgi:hypothetical protein
MASKLNSEFNYRYLVIGETPWEKIKTLKGFLEGRIRAAALEKVSNLKYQAKLEELDYLQKTGGLKHIILNLQADILETESHFPAQQEAFLLNLDEIENLKKLLNELYEEVELTRIPGYTDEQMFEVNAVNEFTVMIGREIQSEIIATGRPSPAKLLNAMKCPETVIALKRVGLIPEDTILIGGNSDPLQIELKPI